MITRLVLPGDKVEMKSTGIGADGRPTNIKSYTTKVYDVLSDKSLEIYLPIEKTKFVLLSVGEEYLFTFHGINGLYQGYGTIEARYKDDQFYVLKINMSSELTKCQRRNYYRYNCNLDVHYRELEKEELLAIVSRKAFALDTELAMKKATMLDLSAGGIRFVTNELKEEQSVLYCCFHLPINGKLKMFEVLTKVLSVKQVDNKRGLFEHRVKYVNMREEEKEEIIRFIFDEERKTRKTARSRQ